MRIAFPFILATSSHSALHSFSDNMARLRQVIKDTPFSKLYDVAAEQYSTAEDIDVSEVKLLYKAFGLGVLKRKGYDPKYARILRRKRLSLSSSMLRTKMLFGVGSNSYSISSPKEILASKEQMYGVGKIKLSGEVGEVFDGYDIDAAEKLIDAAVRARREKDAKITLTRDILQSYATENDRPRIGFGVKSC